MPLMTRREVSRGSGIRDRRWTAIVNCPGCGIEEIDVDAPNRTAARDRAQAILDTDYVTGSTVVDVVPFGATCPVVIVGGM